MTELPKYLINPLGKRPYVIFPDMEEFVFGIPNHSYLNSLWMGTWSVFLIPYRFGREVVWPFFNFQFFQALVNLLMFPVATILLLMMSLAGKVSALRLSEEVQGNSKLLSPAQAEMVMSMGIMDTVISAQTVRDLEIRLRSSKGMAQGM